MRALVAAMGTISLLVVGTGFACAQALTRETTTVCIGVIEHTPDGKEGWYDILGGDYACAFDGKSKVGKAILSVCPVGTFRCRIEAIGERTPNFYIRRIRTVEIMPN